MPRTTELEELDRIIHATRPDQLFAIDACTGVSITYGELQARTSAIATSVTSALMKDKNCVILSISDQYLFTLVYLSLFRAGVCVVPCSPASTASAIDRIAQMAGAGAVVADRTISSQVPLIDAAAVSRVALNRGVVPQTKWRQTAGNAVTLFTSGTTSTPKGVRLGASGMLANATDFAAAVGISSARLLGLLPMHHTNAQIANILVPVVTGSTIICGGQYNITALSRLWGQIEEFGVNYVDVVPTIIHTLLRLPPNQAPRLASLRYFICGAAPVKAADLILFQEMYGVEVLQEYGLSEATCFSSVERPAARRLGTVGIALRRNEIEVRDEFGQRLGSDQVGEVFIRGEYTMLGYVGGDAASYNLTVDEDGWLETGDLGSIDPEGYLQIVGRKKDVIIKGGLTIMPADIEEVATLESTVAEAAAVGVSDDYYGEKIWLFVSVRAQALDYNSLHSLLHAGLPPEMQPDRVVAVSEIPRTDSGKVRRQLLRNQYSTPK
ncbi:class I adenylate-forming enzyme family protein [Pseudonocardia petroleophila]|nr:class I adenylate-forming enzyme family protein [Pseudonocardia petroleophila]